MKLVALKNIIPIVALLFSLTSNGQEKTIEESSRKKPEWVNGMSKDYIIASAYGKDIEEAKTNLQLKLREEIVNAVATYVKSGSEMYIENTQRGNIINTVEQFKKTSSVQTGDIPFLKGLSLSKAEDFYWAKILDKKTGEIEVIYHVKYPFSQSDLYRLTKEFEKQDNAMTDKMNRVIELSKTPESVENMNQYIRQLEQLRDYFIDSRKEVAQLEITRVKEQLNLISIEVISNNPGSLVYRLALGEHPLATAQKPKVRGTLCVQNITTSQKGVEHTVHYNYENCFTDEINNITIEHKIGNRKLTQTVPVELKDVKVEIFVKDPIKFSRIQKDGEEVSGYKLYIPVVAKYNGTFTVNKVSLDLTSGYNIEIEGVSAQFSGKGNHGVTIEVSADISPEDYKSLNGREIEGTIYYTSDETGETMRYKMFNQEIKTE